jgi:RimJ/RimL family protein N-acetyltransferase
MSSPRAPAALRFYRLERAHLDAILDLDYGSDQAFEFLDPIENIVDAVRTRLAHAMIGIEDESGLVGFFVVHPDPRDQSCWWLGWFAIASHHRGRGYGRAALCHVIETLHRIDSCRRIRLLVARDNIDARRLYGLNGFQEAGVDDEGWQILQYDLPAHIPTGFQRALAGRVLAGRSLQQLLAKRARRRLRRQPMVGPCSPRCMVPVRAPPAFAASPALRGSRSCTLACL